MWYKSRNILFALAPLFLQAAASASVSIPGQFIYLDKVNWAGTTHHPINAVSKVGGYARGPGASYSYETLAKFDVSTFSNAQSATLRFHVTGGNTGGTKTVTAYDANKGPWLAGSVTFDTFCNSAYDCPAWNSSLGNVAMNAAQPGWYTITGPNLLAKVQQWVSNPSSNNGLVLTGSFYTYVYSADIDQIELVVDGTTVPPGGGTPPPSVPPVLSCADQYILYSKGAVLVRDRVKVQGGSIRAAGLGGLAAYSRLEGSLTADSATLGDGAYVRGDVAVTKTLTRGVNTTVTGVVSQHVAMNPCDLAEKTAISYGSTDKTILSDNTVTLSPGAYRDVHLNARGAVKLLPGVYNFKSLYVDAESKIFIQAGGDVEINVQDNVFLYSRTQMILEGMGAFPNVRLYSNQTAPFQVGTESKLFGTITAPKAEVQILWRTTMQGSIQAKKVTLESDVVITNSLDTDGDGIPDLIENMMGTDPASATSKPALATPTNWFVNPIQDNSVVYNYSAFQGYTNRSSVSVTYPAGTLSTGLVPDVQIKEANDASLPSIPVPTGWAILGKVFDVTGGIVQGEKVTFGFPLPDGTAPNINLSALTVLHYSGNRWVYVPVTQVQGNAVYAQVSSFSPYVILQNTTANPVIYVDMEYMEYGRFRDGKSWATAYLDLNDALADARVSKKEIWVAGGLNRFGKSKRYFDFSRDAAETKDTLESAFELFNGARLYSGFSGNETDRLAPRSQKNRFRAALTNGWGAIPLLTNDLKNTIDFHTYYPAARIVKAADGAYMEGFIFERAQYFGNISHYVDFKSTLPGMGIYIEGGSMTISNSTFISMRSSQPGAAIYASGSPGTFVDSCEFHSNQSDAPGGAISAPRSNLFVHRSIFILNSATMGGAIDASPLGGVLAASNPDSAYRHTLVLRNCLLGGNTAFQGGAVALKTTATFENTVFAGNVGSTEGGAIVNYAGDLDARNCTFWANSSPSGRTYMGQQWDSLTISLPPFVNPITIPGDRRSSASFRNSILWNVASVTGPEVSTNKQAAITMVSSTVKNGYAGAFSFDPLFYDSSNSAGADRTWITEDDGLYLSRKSPAIDAGSELPQGSTVDILGNPRKTGAGVDLGAFEYNRVAPQVRITSHPARSFTQQSLALVNYTVNGQTGFSQSFPLIEGPNTLVVSKSSFDAVGKDSVVVVLDTHPPTLTVVRPSKDTVVATPTLVVEYRVDNGPTVSKPFTLSPKTNTLTITVTDSAGNSASKVLRVYLAQNGQAGPSVVITSPSKDTTVNRSPVTVAYTLDGTPLLKPFNLVEGLNRVIVDTTLFPGFSGADTVQVTLDTRPPLVVITSPAQDTAVQGASLTVRYTVDGVAKSKFVTLANGLNTITLREVDAAGNEGVAVRKVYYLPGGAAPIVADARAEDTIFTYQLFTLDGRDSHGPSGVPLQFTWRQIQGGTVYINTAASRVAGVVSRGPGRMRFELTVADSAGILPSGRDTVTVEVLEPENALEFAQALEDAKTNQDGAFALTIDPAGEGSRYTLDNSIRLRGSLTGTSGALSTIRWTCNARTGTFQPLGQNWESSAIALDPGDNWITLVYTQGSQIAVDRILVSRGEVDMVGFDMNPNVLWADSAMAFKLVINVYDPAVSNVHLVRITDREVDLGALVDDGTGGDDFASDRRYTLQFNLTPKADSVYWFRVKANKSGVNSYSALYTFHPQQKYNSTAFQDILTVHANASALFEALQTTKGDKAAMDSVTNWLIEQPSVTTAGIGPGEKAICWQYSNGIHAMIGNAPAGTRGSGKVKTKALSPFQYDGPFGLFDDGITGYRGAVIPAAQADTGLFAADSLLLNSSSTDSNVTVEHWKNWGGYSAVMVATHGNTFGYDSLGQIKRKPRQDTLTGASFWAAPYITFLTHQKADTLSGSKYWGDLTSGGKSYPRLILAKMRGGIEYGITAKFFAAYNKNVNGTLVSIGACRSLYNENFWNSVRASGDAKTAMIGYSDYVDGRFAGKSAEIIFKSLVKGKTLKQSVDSVVTFCGQNGNGFCFTKNGKAWDSVAYLEYRGDSNYTLVPRKGRAWAWGSGNGSLNNCVTTTVDTVPIIKNIAKVSGGFGHSLALEVNGTVWGWGWNGAGQLGLAPSGGGGSAPTTNYRSCTPLQVFPGTGYKAIAAGASRSLAVNAAGKVWRAGEYTGSSPIGWTHDGSGNHWAAGVVGVSPQRDTVPGLSNIIAVAVGVMHNLALDANGEVWAWGGDSSGELGFGDTLSRPIPAKIPGLSNIVAIAAGQAPSVGISRSHSLALDRSGNVWAWGENEFGQLGVGDTTDRKSPQLLTGLSRIKSISAGVGGSSAVDSTGKLWVWGWNTQGQLGLGNISDQKSPVQVPALSNIVSVAHGVFPVAINNAGNAMWSCGSACGNAFVSKKNGSLEVGAGGDEFGLSIAP